MSRLFGSLLCACLLACGLGQAAHAGQLFPYEGNGPDGRKALAGYEAMMGGKAYGVTDFIAFDSWTSFDNDAGWGIGAWKGYKLAESVPLTVKGTSLADVAAGKYDAHFARVAQILVSSGHADAYVRLGWEMNGGWYPWAFAAHQADYIAAWRHVQALMKAIPGAQFRFVWCVAQGEQQQWPDWSYPGDDVVDVVAMDVYNQSWVVPPVEPGLWSDVYGGTWSVRQLLTFAAKHAKPYAFPEFGTGSRPDGHGGGDDPTFYTNMAPIIAKAEFAGPWDYDAGDYNSRMSTGERPKAAGAFIAAFGPPTPVVQAPVAPVATVSAKISPAGSVTVTPAADGSATLSLTFPTTPKVVSYTVALSELRKIGFGNGKGGLSGGLWAGGAPWGNFTWASSGGSAQVYVVPK